MTLLKDRLTQAGAPTSESRLAVLAVDAIRDRRGNLERAAILLWEKLCQEEPRVACEALILPYLRDRQRDMAGHVSSAPGSKEIEDAIRSGVQRASTFSASPAPVTRAPPSPQRKAVVDALVKKAVEAIQFKKQTSDGRDWARVGAHELDGMDRDGVIARKIRDHLGTLSHSQRFTELGELMTPKTFNELLAAKEN